jgi:ubiquinone/menaquinone biosynthesis C-methylase UbiE
VPAKQRLDEWIEPDERALKYHQDQWAYPKESTIAFESFVSKNLKSSRNVLDLGAGAGAATAYLAKNHPKTKFTAFDYSIDLIEIGKSFSSSIETNNLNFEQGDWYHLSPNKDYDGCISLQTLSWLPDYKEPLTAIFENLNPSWIGLTSLFYEGDITCRIEVDEHTRNRKTFYNVYSLPAISRLCKEYNYSLKKFFPFVIDRDLKKPDNPNLMSTYTRKCIIDNSSGEERIQLSGPILMNWFMLLIERN